MLEGLEQKALQYLVETGEKQCPIHPIYKDRSKSVVLVQKPDGTHEVIHFELPAEERKHTITTLEGYLGYLNSKCATPSGVVFVSREMVVADLAYLEHTSQSVTMPLSPSEEYKALMHLCGSDWRQKALWRLLATDLHGCIDRALMLSIGRIKVSQKDEVDIEIDNVGVQGGSAEQRIGVSYRDPKGEGGLRAELPEEFTWTGRIWECYEETFSVVLRLELEVVEKQLVFKFHPRRLESVLQAARLSLVQRISAGVPEGYCVFEGSF